ncbi:MAG TPA: hypothetical protein VGF80_08730 [Galbitalea sp.]|jgi:hypothetical protein
MPAEAADTRGHHGNVAARRDIRRAEASRVLGLLSSEKLPARAQSWLADGADSESVRALAAAATETADEGVRLALVAEIAYERGLSFATLQAARTFEAEEIMRARSFNINVQSDIYGLSNGYTDEAVRKLREFVGRVLHR